MKGHWNLIFHAAPFLDLAKSNPSRLACCDGGVPSRHGRLRCQPTASTLATRGERFDEQQRPPSLRSLSFFLSTSMQSPQFCFSNTLHALCNDTHADTYKGCAAHRALAMHCLPCCRFDALLTTAQDNSGHSPFRSFPHFLVWHVHLDCNCNDMSHMTHWFALQDGAQHCLRCNRCDSLPTIAQGGDSHRCTAVLFSHLSTMCRTCSDRRQEWRCSLSSILRKAERRVCCTATRARSTC
jgi:hypothetical protein